MNLGEADLQCQIIGNTRLEQVFSEVVREKQTKKLKWPNTVLVGVTALWWSFASHMQDFGFIPRAEKNKPTKTNMSAIPNTISQAQ